MSFMVPARRAARPLWFVLLACFAATVVDALMQGHALVAASLAPDPGLLRRWGAVDHADVEPWRAVTANFVHFGALHAIFNLTALRSLEAPIQAYLGPLGALVTFVLTGTTAMLVSPLMPSWLGAGDGLAVGASAGIMGLVGFVGVVAWSDEQAGLARALLRWFVLIMVIGIAVTALRWVRIDNLGHALGALSGAASAWALLRLDRGRASVVRGTMRVAVGLAAALVVMGLLGLVGVTA